LRRIVLTAAVCVAASAAYGANAIDRTLMKLSPEERAHQACAVKGLSIVRRDKRFAKADRLMPDVFSRAKFDGSIVVAKGGAVRIPEHWFAISFQCAVTDDQMKATSFSYELGNEIPKTSWNEVGLWWP
jgi:hypothetical protein